MKATGFYLGYLCWYIVWELRRYRVILAKANEMRSFIVDFGWIRKKHRACFEQFDYLNLDKTTDTINDDTHLDLVIQWILYSRTLRKLPVSYLYLAKDSVLTNWKNSENMVISNPVKKNVLYPSERGNVKMCNRIINNLLFVENASILSTHYYWIIYYWNFSRSVMSLKKACEVLTIQANKKI